MSVSVLVCCTKKIGGLLERETGGRRGVPEKSFLCNFVLYGSRVTYAAFLKRFNGWL